MIGLKPKHIAANSPLKDLVTSQEIFLLPMHEDVNFCRTSLIVETKDLLQNSTPYFGALTLCTMKY